MTFSDTVSQHRERQEKSLRRFVASSLVGSIALHGVGLGLRVHPFQPEQSQPEEIVIIVAEDTPPEETFEEVPKVLPEEHFSQPIESELASDALAEPSAATIVEAPPPQVFEPLVEEDSISEDEPEPELPPLPIAEEPTEELTEEPTEESDVAETSPETQNLDDLLEQLRRARERNRRVATENPPSAPRSDTDSTAATAPSSPSVPFNPGDGAGERQGSGEPAGGVDSGRGSRSREIICQGCDFDYPDSARGAEGTAQVIVETDEEGRVVSVTLSRSSGHPELDRAALDQARQRVRLQGAGAGESFPIDINFVQPGSEAADRARERGDRRSITVSEPEPELPATSETAGSDVPNSDVPNSNVPNPAESPEPDPTSEPASEVTPSPEADSSSSSPTPQPTLTPDSAPSPSLDLSPTDTEPFEQPREAEPPPELEEPVPETPDWSSPPEYTPEYTPESAPVPEFLPELNFDPVPESPTAPEPALNFEE